MMVVSNADHLEDLDMADATFATPDLTTFARLDGLGLQVTGQFLEPDRAVLACLAGPRFVGRAVLEPWG